MEGVVAVRVFSVWAAILILPFVFSSSLEAEIFKWVDDNGTTHYSDQPEQKIDRKDFGEAMGRLINLKERINTCQNLPGKIEHCAPYTCEMSHPLFDVFITRHSISGMKGGKCHYEQTMPNNGLMTCNFSSWQRKQYAQLKRDMFSGKTIENETSVEMEISYKMDSRGKTKSPSKIMKEKISYKGDGKETELLFNEAIKNGNCVINKY